MRYPSSSKAGASTARDLNSASRIGRALSHRSLNTIGWGRERGLRSLSPRPVKILADTVGPLPFGSTPSLPTPTGCPICPPSRSCSSVSRRVTTALTCFVQGDTVRICLASSSVHWADGLLYQIGSDAERLAAAAIRQADCLQMLRIGSYLVARRSQSFRPA